jgi:hypothetical protein
MVPLAAGKNTKHYRERKRHALLAYEEIIIVTQPYSYGRLKHPKAPTGGQVYISKSVP